MMLASVFMANDAFLPAIPLIARHFGVALPQVQLGVTFFVLGSFCLQLFVGPCADRFGRRPVLIYGGLIYLLGSLGCIIAPSYSWFMLSRIFQGSAMATTIVSSLAAINEYYEEHEAIKAMAISANITMLAPVFGPIFGAIVLDLFPGSWRNIFVFDSMIGVVAWILLIFYMPETLPKKLRLVKDNKDKRINLFQLFKLIPKILKNKVFTLHSISLACMGFIILIWITGAPIMMIEHLSLTERQYAYYQSPVFITIMIGNFLSPLLAKRYGSYFLMKTIHTLMMFVGIPIMIVIFVLGHFPLGLVLAMSLYVILNSLVIAVKNRFILNISEFKGSAAGVMNQISSVGPLLGSFLASVLGHYQNWITFLVISICAFLAGFLSLIANRHYEKLL